MSCDAYSECLSMIGDWRGQTLEQVLDHTRFGTPLIIESTAGEIIFDRTWPWYANPPAVVGVKHMPRPVLSVSGDSVRVRIQVL